MQSVFKKSLSAFDDKREFIINNEDLLREDCDLWFLRNRSHIDQFFEDLNMKSAVAVDVLTDLIITYHFFPLNFWSHEAPWKSSAFE